MNKLIYIAHPYGGKEENKEKIEAIIGNFIVDYSDCVFVSPVHNYGFLYESMEYIDGMDLCLNLLEKCDELWLSREWVTSKGCCMEYGFAKAKGIKIVYDGEGR